MKKSLLLLLLLSACGRGDEPANDQAAPVAAEKRGTAPAPAPATTESLAGLYEGGSGPQKNQLCIVGKGESGRFGLLVWGGNLHSCSGAGDAVRKDGQLSLRMTGDETCTIDAAIDGDTVTLPATLPSGCAYYCGARATLSGARFTRTGSTEADARKATDIAGDPLCD